MTLKARIRAVDRFIKGCKEDGIYDDLNACCVMAGWDSLAGALTPLKGTAPTNNGLSNYDRGIGITGDGTSAYLNSNRANNADGQNDKHISAYITSSPAFVVDNVIASIERAPTSQTQILRTASDVGGGVNSDDRPELPYSGELGLLATTRSGDLLSIYADGQSATETHVSNGHHSYATYVFARNDEGTTNNFSTATIPFYSIGSHISVTGLAALDARVSILMADLRAIEETGFDRDAIAYIRAVEAADGAYLETSVKIAINNLVAGLKADGLWDAIGSSCLLCGPRTLAGALVPLRGPAPTAEGGWASGDYDRSTGMKGNGSSLYLDSNYGPENLNATDLHLSVCVTELNDAYTSSRFISQDNNSLTILGSAGATGFRSRVVSTSIYTLGSSATVPSLLAVSRASGDSFSWFGYGQSGTQNDAGGSINAAAGNPLIFKGSAGFSNYLASRLAFYSIGTSLDLAKLDSHISSYVTAIGAAV